MYYSLCPAQRSLRSLTVNEKDPARFSKVVSLLNALSNTNQPRFEAVIPYWLSTGVIWAACLIPAIPNHDHLIISFSVPRRYTETTFGWLATLEHGAWLRLASWTMIGSKFFWVAYGRTILSGDFPQGTTNNIGNLDNLDRSYAVI